MKIALEDIPARVTRALPETANTAQVSSSSLWDGIVSPQGRGGEGGEGMRGEEREGVEGGEGGEGRGGEG